MRISPSSLDIGPRNTPEEVRDRISDIIRTLRETLLDAEALNEETLPESMAPYFSDICDLLNQMDEKIADAIESAEAVLGFVEKK